jgi:hypothetical protein
MFCSISKLYHLVLIEGQYGAGPLDSTAVKRRAVQIRRNYLMRLAGSICDPTGSCSTWNLPLFVNLAYANRSRCPLIVAEPKAWRRLVPNLNFALRKID